MGQGLVLHPLHVKAHKTHSLDGSLEAPSVGLRKEEVPLYPPTWGSGLDTDGAEMDNIVHSPMKSSFLLFLSKPQLPCIFTAVVLVS